MLRAQGVHDDKFNAPAFGAFDRIHLRINKKMCARGGTAAPLTGSSAAGLSDV